MGGWYVWSQLRYRGCDDRIQHASKDTFLFYSLSIYNAATGGSLTRLLESCNLQARLDNKHYYFRI